MPMELRKRKAPANPPAPAPAKKTKTAPAKKKVAAKAEEVKKAVAPAKKAAAKKETKKAAEKKEAAPAPAPAAEKAPEPEAKPAEAAKPEAPAAAEPAASASTAAPAAAPAKKGRGKAAAKDTKEADAKPDAKVDAKAEAKVAKADASPKLKVGDALPTDLAEITLDDGTKTTFDALLDASEKGIVLFSYTKASTPGCTTQACALRDNYTQFKDAGYLVYGLSGDNFADNAKFKAKQNLGYPLISDPTYVFHEKLGIKSAAKAGTIRSVIVVQKEGKIIKELKSVQPKTSLDVARKAVGIEAVEEEKEKKEKKETKKEKEAKAKEVAVGKEAPAPAAEAPAAAATEDAPKPAESS